MDVGFASGTIGYHYQTRYALFQILNSEEGSFHSIRLEGLDDVEIWERGKLRELLELKHHTTTKNLTDRDVDLWRTIRIWSKHLANNKIVLPDTKLTLVTTSNVAPDSIAYFLSSDERYRNTSKALLRLIEISNSPSPTLEKFVVDFASLPPEKKKLLIDSICVYANTPDISEIVAKIKKFIRVASPDVAYIDEIYNRLEGLWVDKVIDHLMFQSSNTIHFNDVHLLIHNIAQNYMPRPLPIKHLIDPMPEDYNLEADDRQFVLQLKRINLNKDRIKKAVHDHHRAYAERNDWLENRFILNETIDVYEKRLVEYWYDEFLRLQDRFLDEHSVELGDYDEKQCLSFGRKLYDEVIKLNIPIRYNESTEPYITAGSYHDLADRKKPIVVRWYPKFGIV